MSGFDESWLALREPADRAARDAGLVADLAACLDGRPDILFLDIGCGTGSTWRSLARHLPAHTKWLLLDHDPLLLEEAARRTGGDPLVRVRMHDLSDLSGLPLDGVSVLTASALFDLCSEPFCAELISRIGGRGSAFYAALNYDGSMRWSEEHPLDQRAVEAFNRHQQTDKGFGAALGPRAVPCLAANLEARGYHIRLGRSPWRLGLADVTLQRAFLEGFRQPLGETGLLTGQEIEDWLSFRLSMAGTPGSLCEVGHTDILAFAG